MCIRDSYLGWAHTNNVHDGQDLYKLVLVDGGYKWGDDIKPFAIRTVKLKVRGADGVLSEKEWTIKESVHGPIVREDEDYAYALRVVGQDQPYIFEQYLEMALAKSFDEFQKAASRLQNPFFTTMYAVVTDTLCTFSAAGHRFDLLEIGIGWVLFLVIHRKRCGRIHIPIPNYQR